MIANTPSLWIIAGPNGVGKTTYAKQHISSVTGSSAFINQDEIARGISPIGAVTGEDLITAARVSIYQRNKMLKSNRNFTIETTLSGKSYLKFMDEAKSRGYQVNLIFFYVNSIEESLKRVQRRVESGGHNVAEKDIRRRFPRSLCNFFLYAAKSDHWVVIDNNQPDPIVAADCTNGTISIVRSDLLAKSPGKLLQSIDMLEQEQICMLRE